MAERVEVSAGRDVAGAFAGGAGLRANEGTIAGASAGSVSLLRGGLRGCGTGVDAGGVASGGFCIDFCAGGDEGDAEGGSGRVACVVGCGVATAAAADAVTDALFGEVDVGVEGATCAGRSTLGACAFGVDAMGLCAGGMGADGVLVVVAARGSGCMIGICTGPATRVIAPATETMGDMGVGVGAGIAAAACGNADAGRGASGACGAAGAGATTFAGVRGAAIIGVSTAESMRSPVSTRMAGAVASCATLGVACGTRGATRGVTLDASAVDAVGDVERCAGVAAVAGGSTVGSGNDSVFRTARTRGATSAVEAGGFVGARRGLASASSVAAGFAAARRGGGFGDAGISPGVGTAASAAGDFRLRGVFGRSVSSMRQV